MKLQLSHSVLIRSAPTEAPSCDYIEDLNISVEFYNDMMLNSVTAMANLPYLPQTGPEIAQSQFTLNTVGFH